MVKIITTYMCEVCMGIYDSEDAAKSCEKKGTTQPLKDGDTVRFKHEGKTEESEVIAHVIEKETHDLIYLFSMGGGSIIEVYENELV